MQADRQARRARYAICGLSTRAIGMFALPLIGHPSQAKSEDYSENGELVALLEVDVERANAFNRSLGLDIPVYRPEAFERMVAETSPDVIIATGVDSTHAEHAVAALEHDLDVIIEKPMVVDSRQALAVIEAERRSQGAVRVAHNSRYHPAHMQIKRIIQEGLLGRITNVELVWNLDTYHGSSYFYRWNRDRARSGGMTITKGCHHFDLLNWWLADTPVQVFARGGRNYYGADSPYNPSLRDGVDYTPEEQRERCPYRAWSRAHMRAGDRLDVREGVLQLPYTVEYRDSRPMYIYDKEIEIEDTYSAVIAYRGGASVAYSSNFSSPWEGYTLGINGTRGRLETVHYTAPWRCPFPASERQTITLLPHFGEPRSYEPEQREGGHQGADPALRRDLFIGPSPEAVGLGLHADAVQGAYAVAVGEGVWRSVQERRPVEVDELLPLGTPVPGNS